MSEIFFDMFVEFGVSFAFIDGLVVEGIGARQNH